MTAFHCSKLIRCIVASRVMPALLMSTSIGPSCASIAFTPLDASVEIGDIEFVDRDAGLLAELPPRCVIMSVIGRDLVPAILQRDRDGAADAADSAGDDCHPGHAFLPNKTFSPQSFSP